MDWEIQDHRVKETHVDKYASSVDSLSFIVSVCTNSNVNTYVTNVSLRPWNNSGGKVPLSRLLFNISKDSFCNLDQLFPLILPFLLSSSILVPCGIVPEKPFWLYIVTQGNS